MKAKARLVLIFPLFLFVIVPIIAFDNYYHTSDTYEGKYCGGKHAESYPSIQGAGDLGRALYFVLKYNGKYFAVPINTESKGHLKGGCYQTLIFHYPFFNLKVNLEFRTPLECPYEDKKIGLSEEVDYLKGATVIYAEGKPAPDENALGTCNPITGSKANFNFVLEGKTVTLVEINNGCYGVKEICGKPIAIVDLDKSDIYLYNKDGFKGEKSQEVNSNLVIGWVKIENRLDDKNFIQFSQSGRKLEYYGNYLTLFSNDPVKISNKNKLWFIKDKFLNKNFTFQTKKIPPESLTIDKSWVKKLGLNCNIKELEQKLICKIIDEDNPGVVFGGKKLYIEIGKKSFYKTTSENGEFGIDLSEFPKDEYELKAYPVVGNNIIEGVVINYSFEWLPPIEAFLIGLDSKNRIGVGDILNVSVRVNVKITEENNTLEVLFNDVLKREIDVDTSTKRVYFSLTFSEEEIGRNGELKIRLKENPGIKCIRKINVYWPVKIEFDKEINYSGIEIQTGDADIEQIDPTSFKAYLYKDSCFLVPSKEEGIEPLVVCARIGDRELKFSFLTKIKILSFPSEAPLGTNFTIEVETPEGWIDILEPGAADYQRFPTGKINLTAPSLFGIFEYKFKYHNETTSRYLQTYLPIYIFANSEIFRIEENYRDIACIWSGSRAICAIYAPGSYLLSIIPKRIEIYSPYNLLVSEKETIYSFSFPERKTAPEFIEEKIRIEEIPPKYRDLVNSFSEIFKTPGMLEGKEMRKCFEEFLDILSSKNYAKLLELGEKITKLMEKGEEAEINIDMHSAQLVNLSGYYFAPGIFRMRYKFNYANKSVTFVFYEKAGRRFDKILIRIPADVVVLRGKVVEIDGKKFVYEENTSKVSFEVSISDYEKVINKAFPASYYKMFYPAAPERKGLLERLISFLKSLFRWK